MLKTTPVKFSEFWTHARRHHGRGGLFCVPVMTPTGRDTGVEIYATVSGMMIELVPMK